MRSGVGRMVLLVTASACAPHRDDPGEAASVEKWPDGTEFVEVDPVERAERVATALERVQPIGAPPRAFRQGGSLSFMRTEMAAVELEAGLLQFRGIVGVGSPCVTLLSGVTTAEGELTLNIQAVRSINPCASEVVTIPYEATVDGPGPGSLRVRVIHSHPNSGIDTKMALDRTVVVP
jgi:hypothetical protein